MLLAPPHTSISILYAHLHRRGGQVHKSASKVQSTQAFIQVHHGTASHNTMMPAPAPSTSPIYTYTRPQSHTNTTSRLGQHTIIKPSTSPFKAPQRPCKHPPRRDPHTRPYKPIKGHLIAPADTSQQDTRKPHRGHLKAPASP